MNSTLTPLGKIKPNPSNPRTIKDAKFKRLVESIRTFPKMLELRPIVVNEDMIVLGGNMRLKACKEAGITEVPVIKASDLTPDEQRQFIIKDNVGFGEWDWEMLANEWDVAELDEWGLTIPNWSAGLDVNEMTDKDVDLSEQFDPYGTATNIQRVVFIFDGPDEAESYLKSLHVEYAKRNNAWQVNLSTQSIS